MDPTLYVVSVYKKHSDLHITLIFLPPLSNPVFFSLILLSSYFSGIINIVNFHVNTFLIKKKLRYGKGFQTIE